jgi:hypothetical protein
VGPGGDLTEAAFDRNVEAGVLTRDRALAASLRPAISAS